MARVSDPERTDASQNGEDAGAGQAAAVDTGNQQTGSSKQAGSSKLRADTVCLSDADVAFVRTRRPFCDLDTSAFLKQSPLDKVLKYETRLRRVTPGQVLVRRGDYGNSAMLILAGTASVLHPSPRSIKDHSNSDGHSNVDAGGDLKVDRFREGSNSQAMDSAQQAAPRPSLARRLYQCVTKPMYANMRNPAEVYPPQSKRIGQTDQDVAMFMQDFSAVLKHGNVAQLGPGEMFGEVAAMYRTPHAATVVATEESAVLEITWQGLRELRRDKSFDQSLDDHYRRHWLPLYLREHPLLRFLDDKTIAAVADASTLRSYGRLRWYADYKKLTKLSAAEQIEREPIVVHEGGFPTDLLIVRSGFGRASVRHGASVRTMAYLGAGHIFDFASVLRNCLNPSQPQVHQQSLRAVGMLDVIAIPIEMFAADVMPKIRRGDFPPQVQSLFPTVNRRSKGRKSSDRRSATTTVDVDVAALQSTSLMEFVVGNRLNNGPAAMVIDLDRCTGCNDCVTACATTHDGNSRFKREGPSHGRLQFASACMQCVDPVCMIGCPTGAITRDSDHVDPSLASIVTIDEPTCIGCKTCASSCPYSNIDMVAVVDSEGQAYLDPDRGKPMLKATKCDMCTSGVGGPACVAACPHDALVRIDLTHSRPLDNFLGARQ